MWRERSIQMQKRTLPYNTGKVLIGLHYEPPLQKYENSADADLLQSALLRRPQRISFETAAYAVLAVAAVAVVFLMMVFA